MSIDTSKIIHAPVGGGRYTVTAPIVKEDYGLYLLIEGLELPSTYEVDFSNSEHNGTSVTMIGNSDGVLIPSQFISSGKDVFAFLYHVGVDFGRTVYKFRIPNKLRPDRTDEEPTPEEQSVIDQTLNALNEAVAHTTQDVIDAEASAQSASADAERAEEARTDAQNYATQAGQSAISASQSASQAIASATASAQSAQSAEQTKTEVEGMVDDAQASASASAQSATASANSASQASASATSASQSATSAQGYASQAETSAQTASAKAQNASQSASQASGYAQTAETAKTDAQTAKTQAETARDEAVTAKTAAENAQGKAEDAQEAAESAAASIQASASQIAQNEADILKAFPTDSVSGSIASFPDGAEDIPLKSLVVDINPVQDLSQGDPSPTNICPISGWTGMQLNVNGTTIPISWQTEAGTVYGGRLDVLSGVMTINKRSIVVDSTKIVRDSGTRYHVAKSNIGDFLSTSFARMNKFRPHAASEGWNAGGTFFLDSNNLQMNAYRAFDTRAEFIEEYGELQLCYTLATPIEIQLTPHEVNSLLGTNNIWADTGDTEVTYRADPTLYIQRLTEPDADMIADSNIVSGQFFMVGNSLYRALANIASGATITVGTNAQRVSLSDALNLVNA